MNVMPRVSFAEVVVIDAASVQLQSQKALRKVLQVLLFASWSLFTRVILYDGQFGRQRLIALYATTIKTYSVGL